MTDTIVDDSMLETIDTLRGLADTVGGLRLYSVDVIVTKWTGTVNGTPNGRPGVGTKTTTIYPLTVANGTARTKVVQLSQQNTIMSGGDAEDVDLKVGPFTPPYQASDGSQSQNNTAIATWNPAKTGDGETVRFRVTGPLYPNGAMFKLVSYQAIRATTYTMTIRKTGEPVTT